MTLLTSLLPFLLGRLPEGAEVRRGWPVPEHFTLLHGDTSTLLADLGDHEPDHPFWTLVEQAITLAQAHLALQQAHERLREGVAELHADARLAATAAPFGPAGQACHDTWKVVSSRLAVLSHSAQHGQASIRPRLICLCGPTRLREGYRAANAALTLEGHIVLSCGVFKGDPEEDGAAKGELDALHRRKIALADEVVVVGGRQNAGESTRAEIAYAEALGKPVTEWAVQDMATPQEQVLEALDHLRAWGSDAAWQVVQGALRSAAAALTAQQSAPSLWRHPKFGHQAQVLYRGEGVGGQRIVLWRQDCRGDGQFREITTGDEASFLSIFEEVRP